MNVDIRPIKAPLGAPFVSASGSVDEVELLLLRLEDADGHVGWGEAVTLGGGGEEVRSALEDCREVLARSDGSDPQALLTECARMAVLPQPLAAIDLALWDLAGRRAGQPVWRLLGAGSAAPVEVNATIARPDRAGAAEETAAARAAGFRYVKLKVGLGDDAGRVAAVRAAGGPELEIRLDANGAWSVAEATAALGALEPAGIELCEEPVRGLDQIEELSGATGVALAIDETAAQPGALERRVCTAACLKIARCGGITALIEAARRARAVGYEIYLASTLDGPLGIAAALHAAMAVRPNRACGLATLSGFAGRRDPLTASRGQIAPPDSPGLGEGLVGWY